MTITVGSFNFSLLTAQPFGYETADTSAGLSAKQWEISGLATPSEWLSLLNVYDTWRDLKIQEDPILKTGVVGATVPLTITGFGGQTWSNVPCWFREAPSGDQAGAFVVVNFTLVDAAQALAVALKQEEIASEDDELDLGTFAINGVVLKLRKPPDSYTFAPTLEPTANGSHYVTGPLSATIVKDIEGETNSAGWDSIRSWYESIAQTTPSTGTYYPISSPTATAENKIINGVKTLVYVVSISLALVK
jgi:hypothetical protein